MNCISNQRGFIPVLIMVAVIIVFLAGSIIFVLEKTGFIRSAAVVRETELTERARIEASDKADRRESMQMMLMTITSAGERMFYCMGMVGFAFLYLAITRESNRHQECMAAIQSARKNSPALPADHAAGHSEQEYYYSGVDYTLTYADHGSDQDKGV